MYTRISRKPLASVAIAVILSYPTKFTITETFSLNETYNKVRAWLLIVFSAPSKNPLICRNVYKKIKSLNINTEYVIEYVIQSSRKWWRLAYQKGN